MENDHDDSYHSNGYWAGSGEWCGHHSDAESDMRLMVGYCKRD